MNGDAVVTSMESHNIVPEVALKSCTRAHVWFACAQAQAKRGASESTPTTGDERQSARSWNGAVEGEPLTRRSASISTASDRGEEAAINISEKGLHEFAWQL